MGYVSKTNTITLNAYLTQLGRSYILNGDREDFEIKYFSLSDPDANYLISASDNTEGDKNSLPSGFVPDLTGDQNGCIFSLANGVKSRYFLTGGTAVGQLGTNLQIGGTISTVGFTASTVNTPTISKFSSIPAQYTTGLKLGNSSANEIAVGGERVKAIILPPSEGTSAEIYNTLSLSNAGVVEWSANQLMIKPLTIYSTLSKPSGTYVYIVKLQIQPYNSIVNVRSGYDVLTIKLTLKFGLPTTSGVINSTRDDIVPSDNSDSINNNSETI